MTDLDALLEGIVADPANALRWLVMADWLEEHGQPKRAELVRVHRELLRTCTATRETKARKQLHARMMELMRAGVQPCLPQRTITLPGGVEMRFSFIPPGSFLMGSPESEKKRGGDEQRHLVTLTNGFWMCQTPVTQRQWSVVMGTEPSHFKGGELPVEMVSWDDTQAYCKAANAVLGIDLRLPSEAEWEYSARSGTRTAFYWGTELNGTQANCFGNAPYGTDVRGPYLETPTEVGRYAAASPHPWGLSDVIGNVWEWCANSFDGDRTDGIGATVGPRDDSDRPYRGGSFGDYAQSCRTSFRIGYTPDSKNSNIGFRLAADLSALA